MLSAFSIQQVTVIAVMSASSKALLASTIPEYYKALPLPAQNSAIASLIVLLANSSHE